MLRAMRSSLSRTPKWAPVEAVSTGPQAKARRQKSAVSSVVAMPGSRIESWNARDPKIVSMNTRASRVRSTATRA